jgi:hypothetical protein
MELEGESIGMEHENGLEDSTPLSLFFSSPAYYDIYIHNSILLIIVRGPK